MEKIEEAAPVLSIEEYFQLEETSELKHEFVNGRAFAMGGSSREHNRISLNLAGALNSRLRGGPCEVFMADMKVRVEAMGDDAFYYPDIVVTCDPADRERLFLTKPHFIVEVLSPGTERIDRREKFFAYRQLASLEAYALIAHHEKKIEIARRSSEWQTQVIGPEGTLAVPALSFEMPVTEIYEGVRR